MIEIRTGGQFFGGWKSARIPFGLEQIANSFELGVTDKWPGQDAQRLINLGEQCQVLIDGETVITGWVEDVIPEISDQDHSYQVSGRDATGDLVDCSAIHRSGQWSGARLEQIVRDICQPFGIAVRVASGLSTGGVFATWAIQEGETAYECIERACRMRAVMPVSDSRGGLLLTRVADSEPVASLIEGENLKYARGDYSRKERFSEYIIKGQARSNDDDMSFDDDEGPTVTSQVMASATDPVVNRYRPLIVLAEDMGSASTYKQRAEWERNVRRGRSKRVTARVTGWRNAAGELWRANTIVHLTSSSLSTDADLLVAGGTYILDDQGEVTELKLVSPSAFDLLEGVQTSRLKSSINRKTGAARVSGDGVRKTRKGEDWADW